MTASREKIRLSKVEWNSVRLQGGFSLIEVVVIGAITSVVMLGTVSMFNHLSRSQKSITQSVEFENLALLLRISLQNPTVCATAFKNASGGTLTFPSSLNAATPNLPTAGVAVSKIVAGSLVLDSTSAYNGLYVSSIKLMQVVVGSPAFGSTVPYSAVLKISGSKTAPGSKTAVGGGVIDSEIPISLDLQIPSGGGAAVLTGCSTLGASTATATPTPTATNVPTPPVCTGKTNALHWNGTAWTCDSMLVQGGTPCGTGLRGVTMYGDNPGGNNRLCCWITTYFDLGIYRNFVECNSF